MVLLVAQDKSVLVATLIPHIDFIIPYEFNDVMECNTSLFLMLPKVIQEWVQVSCVKILILSTFQNLRLTFLQIEENDPGSTKKNHSNLVLFNFRSQFYFYWSMGFYFRSY